MSSCPPAIAPDPETDDFLERVERLAVSARSELVGKHRCGRDMPNSGELCDSELPVHKDSLDPFHDMVLSALQPAGRTAHGLRSMRSPQYSCTLTLHTRASPSSKLDIRRSAISVEDNVCCDYFDTFGADRFLLVHFKHIWDDNTLESVRREGLHELFESGLCLAGRHYAVLGGELAGRKEGAPEVGREGLESQALRLWFFAERDDCGGLRRIEVAQLIDWLGEFPRETLPSKVNARIKLGLSRTLAACRLTDDRIVVQADILSPGGHVMTDGCGYISHTLARQIPYDVSNGLARHPRSETMTLPSVVQIRLRCGKGLFKGCLIVVSDPVVCPLGCIVVRDSMQKAGPSRLFQDQTKSVLRVNCTFEHYTCLERGIGTPHSSSILLNRPLCLLLRHLGVPYKTFERLMQNEIHELLEASLSRKQAYALSQRYTRSWSSGPRLTNRDKSDPGLGVRALRFLMAGHTLEEPMLGDLLKRLQMQGIDRLAHCRLHLSDSMCLVGVPDPTGQLKEGEVYLVLPKDRNDFRSVVFSPASFSIMGKVAVTRSPMFYPGDIRVLRATRCPALYDAFKDTSGGLIVFSTSGNRSASTLMSGGDFDGDKYYAIFNPEFVDSIREVDPFDNTLSEATWSDVTSTPSITDMSKTELRWSILSGLEQEASQSIVGRYGNALKAWLDPYVPNGESLHKCYSIYLLALDAAKTGRRPKLISDLLNVQKPHYMGSDFKSPSVAGRLYDLVQAAKSGLQYRRSDVIIDPELTYRDVSLTSQLVSAQQELLRDVYGIPCGLGSDPTIAIGDLWKMYNREYKQQARKIYEDSKTNLEISVEFDILKKHYMSMFDVCVDRMLKDCNPHLFLGAACILPAEDRAMLIEAKRNRCRRQLATVVYLVTYQTAGEPASNCSNCAPIRVPSLSFCWEVCAYELHMNKAFNVYLRETGRLLVGEVLLPSEMQYVEV